jgi:hypothetical protein
MKTKKQKTAAKTAITIGKILFFIPVLLKKKSIDFLNGKSKN